MTPTLLHHPAIDAALATAAALLGMEVVFIAALDEEYFRFERVRGEWPGISEGLSNPRVDSFCHRMLAGAPSTTSHAAADPIYATARIGDQLGITSYVGVPIRGAEGQILGTLCGIDRSNVVVDVATVGVLQELAGIIAGHLAGDPEGLLLRRTADGWVVGDSAEPDLTSAMVLADLLAADLPVGRRPPRPTPDGDEVEQLRTAVGQLEHALAARVTVEQAIGVLAERLQVPPRDAFETLRRVARRGGRRVHDLSREVVRSAVDNIELPDELRRP